MNKKEKKARAQRRNQERAMFNADCLDETVEREKRWKAYEEMEEAATQKKTVFNDRVLRFHEVLSKCSTDFELTMVNVSKLENLISSQEVEDIIHAEVRKFAPYGEMNRAVECAKDKIIARCKVALSLKMGIEPDLFDVILQQ